LYVRDRDGKSWRAESYMVERFIREVPEDERAVWSWSWPGYVDTLKVDTPVVRRA